MRSGMAMLGSVCGAWQWPLVALLLTVVGAAVDFPEAVGKEWRARDVYTDKHLGLAVLFCHMKIADYQREPWKTPMDQMLSVASECSSRENVLRYSLKDVMADQMAHPERYLTPSGFIHHETRCGSTLIANMVAHIPDALMVSEPMIPYKSLEMHSRQSLTADEVRALFIALCHTQHYHTRCFLKLPGAQRLQEFQEVFPSTPWVFLFRMPMDVVVSNMRGAWGKKEVLYTEGADGQLLDKGPRKAIAPCLRMALPQGYTRQDAPEDRCCAALDKLCRDAIHALQQRPDLGVVMDYANLPDSVTHFLWPIHFQQGADQTAKDLLYLDEASHAYSKTMKQDRTDFTVGADAELKEKQLTDAIRNAVETSDMTNSYHELLALQRWTKEGGLLAPPI